MTYALSASLRPAPGFIWEWPPSYGDATPSPALAVDNSSLPMARIRRIREGG